MEQLDKVTTTRQTSSRASHPSPPRIFVIYYYYLRTFVNIRNNSCYVYIMGDKTYDRGTIIGWLTRNSFLAGHTHATVENLPRYYRLNHVFLLGQWRFSRNRSLHDYSRHFFRIFLGDFVIFSNALARANVEIAGHIRVKRYVCLNKDVRVWFIL